MAYLVEIYIVYGLSFILLGAAALLQPSDTKDLPVSRHFWLLGLFGLLHGGKEFFDAWVIGTHAAGASMRWAESLLLIISYVPLFEFGRRAAAPVDHEGIGSWHPLTSVWIYVPVFLAITLITAAGGDRAQALAASARYLLGFPGALAAGLILGRAFGSRNVAARALGMAFLAYAFLGGLIAESVVGFPTWLPTQTAFLETTGVPVQALRAICAITVMLTLSILLRNAASATVAQARARAAQARTLQRSVEERTAALRVNELRLKEAQRIGRIGSWELDLRTNTLTWSDEIYRMFEIDSAQFGTSYEAFLNAIHPEDREMVNTAYTDSLANRMPYEIAHRLQMHDGRIKWVSERCETEFDAAGNPLVSVGTVQDVTEHKLAEETAKESEERLRQAADLASLGHWVWDAETDRCIYCSEENARIHGTSVRAYMDNASALDGEFRTVHPDDREVVQNHFRSLREGKDIDIEYRLLTPRGEVRHVHEIATPVLDDDGKVVRERGSILDLTDMKRTEEQLRQAQKMEAIGQLTGGVAHDFNNLLATIVGNIELIQDRLAIADPRHRLLETAIEAAERGASLTQRLLAFSRRQALSPVPVSTDKLVQGMLDLMRRTLGETIEIEVVGDAGLWLTKVDPAQLENAILNLTINARDAMPDGGKLTIEQSNAELTDEHVAALADVEAGQYVLISVTDTGTGMTADVRERAIEPFFTTKEVGKGTGLGLSMVFGFVKQSGGNVTVYSEVAEGTTIKLYLPRYSGSQTAVGDRTPPRDVALAKDEKILVVEDDPNLRALIVQLLQSLGYSVLVAASGEDALQTLRENSNVDLLLTDVVLPGGMGGVELAERARELRFDLPVLYMSGYAENAANHHGCFDDGPELLQKPFRKTVLADKVRETLDRTAH